MRHNYVYISTIYFSMHQLLNVRLCFSPSQALGGHHQIFEWGLLESNDFGESLLKDKETRYNIDMKVIRQNFSVQKGHKGTYAHPICYVFNAYLYYGVLVICCEAWNQAYLLELTGNVERIANMRITDRFPNAREQMHELNSTCHPSLRAD